MRDTAGMMMHHWATAQNFAFSPKKPVGRRVNTLCQGEDGLRQQLVIYHAYYNFCLPHARCAGPVGS